MVVVGFLLLRMGFGSSRAKFVYCTGGYWWIIRTSHATRRIRLFIFHYYMILLYQGNI